MAEVTILIPNYRTLELTQLCLRLIRQYTDPALIKVIVIDNDSQDASLTYLRSLHWITLLERPKVEGESAPLQHAKALDLALTHVDTPYVLSIHTDTLVKHPDWLPFLLSHIKKNEKCAGVGSWKLEQKSWYQLFLKKLEQSVQKMYYYLSRRKRHAIAGYGNNHFYLRSHCALYRTQLLKEHQLHFADGDEVAGKSMHRALVNAGYQLEFLESEILLHYLDHINHATMVLNPELGASAQSIAQGRKRLAHRLAMVDMERVLANHNLDQ